MFLDKVIRHHWPSIEHFLSLQVPALNNGATVPRCQEVVGRPRLFNLGLYNADATLLTDPHIIIR